MPTRNNKQKELSNEIEQHTREFERKGGRVKRIPSFTPTVSSVKARFNFDSRLVGDAD